MLILCVGAWIVMNSREMTIGMLIAFQMFAGQLTGPKLLIFDEATSGLDAETTEHFAQTINQLRGKVGTIFIAHQLPRALAVDAVVQLGVR